jgi:hypothetical protein
MAKDVERDEWLDHFRAWGESLVDPEKPELGINWQRINIGEVERQAHVTPGCLTRWWNRVLRGAGQTEARITRPDYFKLCPWLATWYKYDPPTVKWQIL